MIEQPWHQGLNGHDIRECTDHRHGPRACSCMCHEDQRGAELSEQMQNLLKRFGVTTEAELLEAIAQDQATETEEPIEDMRAIAGVLLDRMLEAEYQRIEGGAYDR